MTGIPEWVMVAIVGVILATIGWGVRRLLEGQDAGVKELTQVSQTVTKICGNLDLANQRVSADKDVCDERHHNNMEEHERILERLEKLKH